jgi:hypothetical protein
VSIADKAVKNDLPRFRTFEQNKLVNGRLYTPVSSDLKSRFAPSILIDNVYIIPLSSVQKMTFGKASAEGDNKSTAFSSGVMDELKETGNGYKTGLIIGGLAGVATAMAFRWSIWKLAVAGALIGSYAGYQISKARTEVNKFQFVPTT